MLLEEESHDGFTCMQRISELRTVDNSIEERLQEITKSHYSIMNFKITKSKISEPLSLLASVAESRQSIPILSNIYIKAENNSISLIATDLEIELSFKIKCDSINEQGETTVSARKMFDLTDLLEDETTLEFSLKDNQLTVTAKKFNGGSLQFFQFRIFQ